MPTDPNATSKQRRDSMYQIQEASELELAYATLMKETMNHNKKLLHRLHQLEAEQEKSEIHTRKLLHSLHQARAEQNMSEIYAEEDAFTLKECKCQLLEWKKRAEDAEKELASCQKELASCQEELSNMTWERDELVEDAWARHHIAVSAEKNNNTTNEKIKINEDDDWDQICDKMFPILSLHELVE